MVIIEPCFPPGAAVGRLRISSSKVAAKNIAEFAGRWSIDMSRARTVVSPRRFAVTVQCNTGLDLIFVDASTIAYAREQARAKHGGDARILATRAYRKGMAEATFDPHGVLALEREAQYERHALPLAERRALDEQLVVARLVGDVAKELYALAASHRRSRDELPRDLGGPYHREAMRLEAVANAYDDAAKRVNALLSKLPK